MNSKEALEFLTETWGQCYRCSKYDECHQLEEHETICENAKFIIIKSLNRLEKLEKDHNKLKEKYKHRAETSNDLCKAVKQYEKAFEILSDKLELTLYHNKILNTYSIELMCFEEHLGKYINQEEYEILKEVLGND